MRRSFLLTASAMGLMISLLAGTGLFAALVDTADTGPNSVDTAPLAGSSDLQLATWDSVNGCGAWQEDLSSGLITALNVAIDAPTVRTGETFCIRNIGSRTVDLSVSVFGVEDTETDECTGDEADSGDQDCALNDPGELSAVIGVEFFLDDCVGNATIGFTDSLTDMVSTPLALLPIAPGNTSCFVPQIQVGSVASETQLQQAQSDRVTWRYRFTGTATS